MNTCVKVELKLFYDILPDCPFKRNCGHSKSLDSPNSPGVGYTWGVDSPGVAFTLGVRLPGCSLHLESLTPRV